MCCHSHHSNCQPNDSSGERIASRVFVDFSSLGKRRQPSHRSKHQQHHITQQPLKDNLQPPQRLLTSELRRSDQPAFLKMIRQIGSFIKRAKTLAVMRCGLDGFHGYIKTKKSEAKASLNDSCETISFDSVWNADSSEPAASN